MNSVDWKRKLSSRKFWVAIAGFVAGICIACGLPEATVTQITGIIMSGASVIGYLIAEGLTDASNSVEG